MFEIHLDGRLIGRSLLDQSDPNMQVAAGTFVPAAAYSDYRPQMIRWSEERNANLSSEAPRQFAVRDASGGVLIDTSFVTIDDFGDPGVVPTISAQVSNSGQWLDYFAFPSDDCVCRKTCWSCYLWPDSPKTMNPLFETTLPLQGPSAVLSCKECRQRWFADLDSGKKCMVGQREIDQLIAWNKLDHRLSSADWRTVESVIEMRWPRRWSNALIPCRAEMRNGEFLERAHLLFTDQILWQMLRKTESCRFARDVKSVHPSPLAYSAAIRQAMSKLDDRGSHLVVHSPKTGLRAYPNNPAHRIVIIAQTRCSSPK